MVFHVYLLENDRNQSMASSKPLTETCADCFGLYLSLHLGMCSAARLRLLVPVDPPGTADSLGLMSRDSPG